MKSIDGEKQRLLRIYAKKNCGFDDPASCERMACACSLQAEVRALINTVIPEDFRRYNFRDFSGTDQEGNRVLDDEAARLAKEKLAHFIWGDKSLKDIAIAKHKDLLKESVLGEKIKNGFNTVLHGSGSNKGYEQPLGKTFIASILTREAINLRCLAAEYGRIRYAWVDFSTLVHALRNDPEKECDYLDANWLVIDNIGDYMLNASDKQRAFNHEKLDAFFFHRIEYKLSTVLVFQFDINVERSLIKETFGTAVSKIVDSRKTMTISLK